MNKIHVIAMANTFAVVDIVIHSIAVFWMSKSPESFLFILRYFVEGLKLEADPSVHMTVFDYFFGTALEGAFFWVLGAFLAICYNFFLLKCQKK